MTPPDNTLVLEVGGVRLLGWQSVRVTRGIERMPSDFSLEVTERNPDGSQISVSPGAPCRVRLGGDLVLTGYVDRYGPAISAGRHTVSVTGRSKAEDVVDCAAVYPGAQVSAGSVLQLTKDLSKPYSVDASGEDGGSVPPFNINLGETAWEIIDRVTRYAALLCYDDTAGNLVLAKVGTQAHASGFEQGINVQDASVSYGMDQRFSEYVAAVMSFDRVHELGEGGNLKGRAIDQGVPRFRRRVIVSEQSVNGQGFADLRARWECHRRWGRSQMLTVLCDSWRDSAGKLWEPNMLADVHFPALKILRKRWLISEVSYERASKSGTTARVVLMPPEAFFVEPIVLQPFDPGLNKAIQDSQRGAGAAPGAAQPQAAAPGTPAGVSPVGAGAGDLAPSSNTGIG